MRKDVLENQIVSERQREVLYNIYDEIEQMDSTIIFGRNDKTQELLRGTMVKGLAT